MPARDSGWHQHSRRLSEAMGFKACVKCGERKRADAFYQDKHAPGGVRQECKACEGYWMSMRKERRKKA